MFTRVWRFRPAVSRRREFEAAYGPAGAWAELFRLGAGYLGTELEVVEDGSGDYLTIDRWESRAAWEAFRGEHAAAYEALDRQLEALTDSEWLEGEFVDRKEREMGRQVHVLVFDGFADWEPSYTLAELRRSGQYEVVTVGFSREAITSMGGLRVLPDCTLTEVQAEAVLVLILPGGDLWESEAAYPHGELEGLLGRIMAADRPIAAICGATVALARAGLLNDRRHTSNMPTYLSEMVPYYQGQARYEPALAVRDRGIITASGLGPVDFAREVFAEIGLFSASDAALWFDMFKHGAIPETEKNVIDAQAGD